MYKSALLTSSALAFAACLYAPQASAATATAEATEPSAVAEITVIATKREENIQRVPVAVTAFGAEQRKLMGIVIIQDIADFSPSLNWTDIDDRVYIRGIGRNSDNLNNTSGVAIYYNGIYYGANAAVEQQKSDLFIGNVEVDNGPQNTLHGSNADGGIVQFTSKHPTDTWYGEIRAGVSNYDTGFVESVISGPINDHLKFRLGGNFTDQRGGFFRNYDGSPQGGNLVLGGSGQTEYFEAQLEGHWNHLDAWIQASTGDFIANTHGAATLGNEPTTHSNPALADLIPSDFYGLCGIPSVPGSANDIGSGCETGPAIVPGSVKSLAFTADLFPGNNPGNLDKHTFLETMNGINSMTADVQISTHVTWHAPSFDVAYLGGYQNFHYVLAIPDQYGGEINAGILGWQEKGAANAGAATSCLLAGNSLAACQAPLQINPTPDFLTFNEFDQAFSHELNFTSTWASPFQYVAGLYWYRERWNQPVEQYSTPGQAQMGLPVYYNLLGGGPGGLCPGGGIFNEFQTCAAPPDPSHAASAENTAVTYNSYAVYGQFSYKFNDDWKFSGAVRYTSDHKSGWQTWRVLSFDTIVSSNGGGFLSGWGSATPALDITALAACTQAGPICEPAFPGAGPTVMNVQTGNAERTISDTWSAITGEANITWTPNASTLAYFKYSRGYKSGGWSTYTIGPNPEVGAEYVDAFEIGGKKTIGREWTLNGDAFYYNYYGEQVPLSVVNQINQIVPILYNLPLVHTWGIELWGTWRPIDNLALSLSYSHLSAKIAQSACVLDTTDPLAQQPGANTTGCVVPNTQTIVGQTVPGATPNKISLNALYTWNVGPGKLTFSGTFIWRDGTYDDVFNRWYTFQPASTQVNLRATLTGPEDRWNIIAFINNVFDTTAYDGSTGGLIGTVNGKENILQYPFLNAPRTMGLQVQYRWQ